MADTAIAVQGPPQLPEQVVRRNITEGQWRTLCNSLYPGANPNSVLLVVDYCQARALDPMKKPVHIVPMEVKDARSGEYVWRDVVLPGIYEYRTTAHRTGEYLGHTPAEYGPEIEAFGLKVPEWCSMTVYRWNGNAREKVPFPVQVFFTEVVATRKDRKTGEIAANARWSRAPRQMLTKCTEAAGLREAFPEELGGQPTAEEMDGQRAIDAHAVTDAQVVSPLDTLPEALRDNIERAFTALALPVGRRLALVNEYLNAPNVVPEEAAERLLEWCRDEYAKTKPRPARAVDTNARRPRRQTGRDAAPAGDGGAGSEAPAASQASAAEDIPPPNDDEAPVKEAIFE